MDVYDQATGRQITDIDEILDDTLFEEKSATNAADVDGWVADQVTAKFYAYVEARRHPPLYPYYQNAPICFVFEYQPVQALWDAIIAETERLQALHPDVDLWYPVVTRP